MALAMMSFTTNDTMVKFLSETMPMGQIVFMRNLIASVVIFLIAYRQHALRPIRLAFSPYIVIRIIGEVGGTVTFLIGLSHIPIGNASAILQALPLAVTMGAALFLGEPVGWRRWSAILVGFIGVLVIVRPGVEGFSPYALIVAITVLFAAGRDIATRKIDPSIPPLFISSLTAPAVALAGLFLDPPTSTQWVSVGIWECALLIGAASLILVAYHFIIHAMREGDISFIAPFRYSSLIVAILFGYLVFGDIPDIYIIIGALMIVASGLYTIYRERVRVDAGPIAASSTTRPSP
ncbi:MAG: EamA family transporter [Rhizobiales bacterium]|nr:EamA family transporter [Hyphomicrobiales bacterium]MBA68678.1 EamA family transporter [Hyphomicrobiales bacterium]